MFKPSNIAAFALLAAIAANTVNAADTVAQQAAPVVATVNGTPIPQSRLEFRVKASEQQGQPVSPEQRKMLRDDLINMEVLAQQAATEGVDKQDEVVQQLELVHQNILAQAYLRTYAKAHPVTEAAMKEEYEKLKQRLGAAKEYKLAHILVATEAEAQAVIASLKKKAKFSQLAKEKSNDPGSKNQGGDLGWMNPAQVVPEFARAITGLTKGEVSAPVQTQFGWHIIRLDDTRDMKVPTFEELRAKLEKHLQDQLIQDKIKALRANAEVK